MQNNCNDINTILNLVFSPGDVFEVRCLDATTPDWRKEHTEAGYFTFENIDKMIGELNRISARGVYFTPNPVHPDLLARSANRFQAAKRNAATTDADILCRRWLLIDCDPVRRSGISSTDDEHDAALYKAIEISEGMRSRGWPEPVMLDSGNGAQLMYHIDLPAADDNLVQKVLQEFSNGDTDEVKIDTTVHNPARIWRLSGTPNRKGDETDERRHRIAKIISIPEKLEIVGKDKLHAVLQSAKGDNCNREPSDDSSFYLDAWIAEHCPEAEGPFDWKNGRKWIFPVCPFNEAHNNRSAVITEQANGAIAFTCHHNGCINNDWHALRELKGDAKRQPENLPAVDLSRILNLNKPREKKSETLFPDPGPLPDKLVKVPGFVNDVMNLSLDTAPYPNHVLAFTGALAFLAFLVGRKVKDKRDNRSNLYLIALADSGTGKDHPRKVNFNLAFMIGLANCMGDTFTSGAAIEDALFIHPSMFFQTDEFDCIFNTMKYNKDNNAETINEKLLKLYGASNSLYPIRKKAVARLKNSGDQIEVNHIVNPSLIVMGTAIPRYFYESLSRRVLENGLVARCIFVEAGSRGKGQMQKPVTPSDSLLRAAKYLVNLDLGGNLSHENPRPLVISETPEATRKIIELQTYCDGQYDFYHKRHEASAMALWARTHEKICKLALLHGISSNVYQPMITEKSVDWAFKFVEHLTKRMLFMADSYVYENVFDEKCQKVVRLMRQNGGDQKHSLLLKHTRESLDMFKRIIETLQSNGTLESYTESGKGRPAVHYRLLE